MKKILYCMIVFSFLIIPLSAQSNPTAGVLFDNPSLGTSAPNAYAISYSYAGYDDFVLNSNSTVSFIGFRAWTTSAETFVTQVNWSIYSNVSGTWGSPLLSGTSSTSDTPLGYSLLDPDNGSYAVNDCLFSVGNLNLPAGVYWLELSNAITNNASYAYWEDTSGVSMLNNGYEYGGSSIYLSNVDFVFTVIDSSSPVPEPATMLLLGLGLVGLAGLRKKF
ncbi:MAG: PEP-CTERM sorting domain-containing protein [Syntrophales bacterium]